MKLNFICLAATFLLNACLTRSFNTDSKNSTLLVVPSGSYLVERVPLPSSNLNAAVQRVAPSSNLGQTSHYVRGWLTCSINISKRAACHIEVGNNMAVVSGANEIMKTLQQRVPVPRDSYGSPIYEWSIRVPFENRLQVTDGTQPVVQVVEFGLANLSDAPENEPKKTEPTIVAYAIMGVRLEPKSIIPTMQKLKQTANIPNTKNFLDADLTCLQQSCYLATQSGADVNGAEVRETIVDSTHLRKALAAEWTPFYGKSSDDGIVLHSQLRLYEEVENFSDSTASKSKNERNPKRSAVALATFYQITLLN